MSCLSGPQDSPNESIRTTATTQKPKQAKKQKCSRCLKKFQTRRQLRAHQTLTGHCYCPRCNCFFAKALKHVQHVRKLLHKEEYRCCDCRRPYPDQDALTTHCCACDMILNTEDALAEHMAFSPIHATYFKCAECTLTFSEERLLNQHRNARHKPSKSISCPINKHKCQRTFAMPSALLNHLESGRCKAGMSRQRLNQLVIQCDGDHFITSANADNITDITQKLEHASMDSSLSSWQVIKVASPHKKIIPTSQSATESQQYHFTPPATTFDDEDSESDGEVIFTPSTETLSPRILTPTSQGATESRQYRINPTTTTSDEEDDGSDVAVIFTPFTEPASPKLPSARSPQHELVSAFSQLDLAQACLNKLALSDPHRCPSCPARRSFKSAKILKEHMNSAAHAPKIFHCPAALMSTAASSSRPIQERSFTTLSGLAQHLEAGACDGGIETFRNVFKYIDERLEMLGLGSMKMLAAPQ